MLTHTSALQTTPQGGTVSPTEKSCQPARSQAPGADSAARTWGHREARVQPGAGKPANTRFVHEQLYGESFQERKSESPPLVISSHANWYENSHLMGDAVNTWRKGELSVPKHEVY